MLKRITILLLLALFLAATAVPAQEEKENRKNQEDEEEFFWDRWGKSKWFNWRIHGNPYIELSYGLSQTANKTFDFKFNDLGLAEARFGYRDLFEGEEEYLLEMNESYLYLSMIKKDFTSASLQNGRWNGEFLRFGFGSSDGLGYKFGAVGILPYHSSSFGWTSLRKADFQGVRAAVVTPDDEYLAWVGDGFRFGRTIEGGVKFELASTVSLNASYEAAVIYPRHLFWYWAGSSIIEEAGMGIVSHFTNKIEHSSPSAGPIVNFILKNAYSYAFYLLKKDRMNWPFETEAPMTIETFKVGITFTF